MAKADRTNGEDPTRDADPSAHGSGADVTDVSQRDDVEPDSRYVRNPVRRSGPAGNGRTAPATSAATSGSPSRGRGG